MLLRALLVEDSEDDAILIVHELQKGFSVIYKRVEAGKEMTAALKEQKWDVVISDYVMPKFSGLEALKVLKESGLGIPFIIVSGKIGEETAVDAMNAGVHDYIIKDNMARLLPAVKRELDEAKVREKQRRGEEKLREYRKHLENLVKLRTAELAETNEQLKKELTDRKKAEEAISKSLVEKEILLKEIHHRVKNNLQVILSLLRLGSRNITSKTCNQILQDSESRIRVMALVHEILYKSENPSNIALDRYVAVLADNEMRTLKNPDCRISLDVDVENMPIGIDTAITCGLIINELLSNSLKHAFASRKSGSIMISLKSDKENIRLSVSDDGKGFPKNVDFTKTESLGLQLVNALTAQIDGTVKLDTKNGTKFIITFPKERLK